MKKLFLLGTLACCSSFSPVDANSIQAYDFSGIFILESDYGRNTNLHVGDKYVVPGKHTLDLSLVYTFTAEQEPLTQVMARCTARSKGTWGVQEDIAVANNIPIITAGGSLGEHGHFINRHLLWMRELWLQFAYKKTSITAGFVPFELGRGISLGAAYLPDTEELSYYNLLYIDQFTPGFKISHVFGEQDTLMGDIFIGILSNYADTFDQVNRPIRMQEIGGRLNPARGFGIVDTLCVAHLLWKPYKRDQRSILLEPYILFDYDPTVSVHGTHDAKAHFGIVGFAFECIGDRFEFGGEIARNFGYEKVRAFDNNHRMFVNLDGKLSIVNSQVLQDGELALATPSNEKSILISPQSPLDNGEYIPGTTLQNGLDRFIPYYRNKYTGYVALCDGGYWLCPKTLQGTFTIGIYSGGEDPNKDLLIVNDSAHNKNYTGFVGLQETYSGLRVPSVLMGGGIEFLPNYASFPYSDLGTYPTLALSDSNLSFVGIGTKIVPRSKRPWNINFDLLAYGQPVATKWFTRKNNHIIQHFARHYLGTEANIVVVGQVYDQLKLNIISAVFFPGQAYRDIRKLPVNANQDATSTKTAFYLSAWLEYLF